MFYNKFSKINKIITKTNNLIDEINLIIKLMMLNPDFKAVMNQKEMELALNILINKIDGE